ncbi:MAG TPA: hypothetical protein EYP14_12105, partial [Planctomycetaceae bacterium]|nr:hypothetical protein [Planctomycetaceae bacterium]
MHTQRFGPGAASLAALTIVGLVVLIAFSMYAEAADIIVDDDWAGADYATIQDAINASSDGDHIYVYAGTYQERLVIGVNVTITGNGTSTLVQPTTTPTAGVYDVEIDANGTVIEQMLFDFNGPADDRSGNGIVVSDLNDPPTVNVVIRDNTIYTGDLNTGIQTGKNSDVGGLVIRDNIFYCDWDNMGEGIYVNPFNGTGNVTIYHN